MWARREMVLMPGVCFIFSGLCLLLQGAVECTARGVGWGGAGEAAGKGSRGGRPASCCVCLLFKEKADSVPLSRLLL